MNSAQNNNECYLLAFSFVVILYIIERGGLSLNILFPITKPKAI